MKKSNNSRFEKKTAERDASQASLMSSDMFIE
jgi:hypothetical protein